MTSRTKTSNSDSPGRSSPGTSRSGGRRPRHIPQRTCVACRRTGDQASFVRITRSPEGGVEVDEGRRRQPGRGAYLCREVACWERALSARHGTPLGRSLRGAINEADREALTSFAARFTTTTHNASSGSDAGTAPPGEGGQKERDA